MQTTIADANHRGFWGYLGLEAFTITWACWLALVPSWQCLPPYSSAAYVCPLQQDLCHQHCPGPHMFALLHEMMRVLQPMQLGAPLAQIVAHCSPGTDSTLLRQQHVLQLRSHHPPQVLRAAASTMSRGPAP